MEIVLSRNAFKQYSSLPINAQKKIHRKLELIAKTPEMGKKLTGELKGLYSQRAWPYRILYEINLNTKRIEIHGAPGL